MANYMNPNYQADTPPTQGAFPGAQPFQQPQQPGIGFQGPQGYPQAYPQYPGMQATPGFTALPGYQPTPGTPTVPQLPFFEQSYIENILRLNKGKVATIYMNFENSQWGSKVFKGVVEAAGKDHIILSDPVTGMRYILLSIYLNYITFDEEIEYEYPFAALPTEEPLGTAAPLYNVPNPSTQFRKKDQKNKS